MEPVYSYTKSTTCIALSRFGIFRQLILLFLWHLIGLGAVTPAQYHFDGWTTDDGLPQNTVRTILQTSEGYLWFTTLDGLVRFDGVRFTVFNKSNSKGLPGNRFINLFAEADNTLWICTEGQGIVRYKSGEFRTFTTADGLPSNDVIEMSRALDGTLTAVTRYGISRFDGNRFGEIENQTNVEDFKRYAASSGTIWEIDKSRLLASRNGETKTFDLPEKLKQAAEDGINFYISAALFEDKRQNLWIAYRNTLKSSEVLLYKFSGGSFEEIRLENMPRSFVFDMEEDRDGNLWLATQKDGACRLSENELNCFTPANGLPDSFVRSILKDREGSLWFATEKKGICRLTEQAISPLPIERELAVSYSQKRDQAKVEFPSFFGSDQAPQSGSNFQVPSVVGSGCNLL